MVLMLFLFVLSSFWNKQVHSSSNFIIMTLSSGDNYFTAVCEITTNSNKYTFISCIPCPEFKYFKFPHLSQRENTEARENL